MTRKALLVRTQPQGAALCTRRDLNPHTLRYRNLSPVGVYRNSARCSEPAGSQSSSLQLATSGYAWWTIQGRFRTSDAEGHRTGIRGLDALLKPTAGRPRMPTVAPWPGLASLSYPNANRICSTSTPCAALAASINCIC